MRCSDKSKQRIRFSLKNTEVFLQVRRISHVHARLAGFCIPKRLSGERLRSAPKIFAHLVALTKVRCR